MKSRNKRGGFTLVDITVAAALSAIVLGSLGLVGNSGARLFQTSVARTELEGRARRTLTRIQDELLGADHGSLAGFPQAPLWAEQLAFEQPASFAADGEVEWRTTLIELRYEPGETNDGTDEDGDGLVDERMVVLVRDWNGTNERQTVLCRGVSEFLEGEGTANDGLDGNGNDLIDEAGLTFARRGENLVVRLTLEDVDTEGVRVLRTFETVVWLRN